MIGDNVNIPLRILLGIWIVAALGSPESSARAAADLAAQAQSVPLLINEILASNSRVYRDPQGHFDDWIELHNTGDVPLNAAGLYLTNDWSKPTKWQIPADRPVFTMIPARGYLLIWADGDTEDLGLHASFRLSAGGGKLALFAADGQTLIDAMEYGEQTANASYGRDPTAANEWRFFAVPTPGKANTGAYLGAVADLKFSHARGFYTQPLAVTITTTTPGASIYYTVDDSSPFDPQRLVPTGRLYTGPVAITTTTALRAVALKTGWMPTKVVTHTYIFPHDVARQATHPQTRAQVTPPGYPVSWGSVTGDYQMDPDVVGPNGTDLFNGLYARTIQDDLQAVPTICLVMSKDDWFGSRGIYINKSQDGTERVASFEFIDPGTGQSLQVNCALAMQGGISGGGTSLQRWKTYKLSMRPRFKPQLDDGTPTGGPSKLNFKLFPNSPAEQPDTVVLDAVLNHSWLHAGVDQQTTALYIQDQYVSDLHNAMGGHSGHGFYAHVYINTLYWGMYYIHERPDHAWAAAVFGGDESEYDALKHADTGVINHGRGGNATTNYNALVAAANAVGADPTNPAKYLLVCTLLDVDDFIAYLLANYYCGNHDWPHKNWYATRRNVPGGQWRFHSWDAEHTLEGDNQVGRSPSDIHAKLVRNAEYRLRFADLVRRHFFHGGPLTPTGAAALFKVRVNQADRAIVGESARWGDNRRSYPYTRQDWLNTVNAKLNTFFPVRANQVLGWLKSANLYPNVDAPEFHVNGQARHGGAMGARDTLSMTPSGTIWFTLDGTDPRVPGTTAAGVSPSARRYAGPIQLPHSVPVKARTLSGTTWSALTEAVFAVGPVAPGLRISEIMYHPPDTGNPDDPNTEYLELTNIASESIDLNLVRFTKGVGYTFPSYALPPGGYCLVVKDLAAFERRYGLNLPVVGQYSGSLDNSGERIELVDAAGQVIQSFKYADNWFKSTDGQGYSLTVRDPKTSDADSLNDKAAWQAAPPSPGREK
ncbi:MAG: hypothetical protein FJ280_05830 [Planctomycetes bacterium]|nr:hypothetical protein [Planctomycetota bacterium]